MNEDKRSQLDQSLPTSDYYAHDPEWQQRSAASSGKDLSYADCVRELINYLQPLWTRGRRALRRFVHKLLRPFRKQSDVLRLIAGASVKLLFISCLLYGGPTQALSLDPGVTSTLESMMQIEAADVKRELVVFDPSVEELPLLLSNFNRNVDYLVLDRNRDGIEQIATALNDSKHAIGALHIVAHGQPGQISLGSSVLSQSSLNQYSDALLSISNKLSGNKDILLYGCNTAQGGEGKRFVSQLKSLTGADIAASNNLTGAKNLGGDWRLEVTAGQVETPTPFIEAALQKYRHVLATITVTNSNNSGAGSLRQAITDATSGDTITFNAGYTIALSSQLTISKNLTIDGDLNDDGTPDVILDANSSSRVVQISSGTVTLQGLTIREGLLYGNGGHGRQSTGDVGSNALGAGISNSGTLTILDSVITANVATGGGGGGAGDGFTGAGIGSYWGGYGGGAGSGFSSIGGGTGGKAYSSGGTFTGATGSSGSGGGGGGYYNAGAPPTGGNGYGNGFRAGGNGGSTSGGGGGGEYDSGVDGTNDRSYVGGNGGSAGTSGGGGGGSSFGGTSVGGKGGDAIGGIYNDGTLYLGRTTISSNLAAGGGGGGGHDTKGAGGVGVAAIYNDGGTLNYENATLTLSSNTGSGGYAAGTTSQGAQATSASNTAQNYGGTVDSGWTAPVSNNAPTATPPSAPTVAEDDGATDLNNDIQVADSDSDDQTVTMTITGGTVTMGTTGITFGGSGNGTASFTADGTLTAINTALDAATFTPTPGLNGTNVATISFKSNDGTIDSSDAAVTFSISAVNDQPTVTGTPASVTVTEDTETNIDLSAATFADVEGDSLTVTLAISAGTFSTPADGSAVGSGVTETLVDSTTITLAGAVADINTYLDTATNIKYTGASNAYGTAAATITLSATDGADPLASDPVVNIDITAVNDEPTLTATGFNPTFTEGNSAKTLYNAAAVSTIESGDILTGLILTVTNVNNGTDEILNIDGTDIALTHGYNSTTASNSLTCNVSLSGTDATVILTGGTISEASTQTLVDSLTYQNDSNSPNTLNRVVTLTSLTDDGGGDDTNATLNITSTVTMVAVNDAPNFSAGATLTAVDEDTTNPTGATTSSLLSANFSDPESDSFAGIAISADASNTGTEGDWEYSTDGSTWYDIGSVSTSSALLLSTTTKLRFVPVADYNGTPGSLTAYAVDDSSATTFTSGASTQAFDTTADDGTSKVSAAGVSVRTSINAQNDAPSFSAGATLTAVDEDTSSPAGATTSSLLSANFSDTDSDSFAGIAISADASNTGTEGDWEYSTDGSTWYDIGSVSTSSALLLSTTTKLRFVPVADYNGTPGSLTAYAVDDSSATTFTSGASAQTFDTTTDDGTSKVSAAGVSVGTSINVLNDTPTINVNTGLSLDEGATGAIPTSKLSATDVDNDDTTLTFTVTVGPSNGQLENTDSAGSPISSFTQQNLIDGKIQYVHNGGETTSDSFTFKVSDSVDELTGQTFSITVNGVNDNSPVGVADSYTIDIGQTRTVSVPGVLDNDTDADSVVSLTATLISAPTYYNSFTLNSNGSFSYTHDGTNSGDDSFTYQADDGNYNSATTTVTLVLQTKSKADTELGVSPSSYRFGVETLSDCASSTPVTFTVSNSDSSSRDMGTLSFSGTDSDQFALGTDNCSNTTVAGSGTCTVEVKFCPTSVGSKGANLLIPSDDIETPTLSAQLYNHEDIAEEAGRRLPPVLYNVAIPETMTENQTYTLTWSLLGYHDSYMSNIVFFDCSGIVDGSCGEYSSDRFDSSGHSSPLSSSAGPFTYNGEQSQIYNYSYDFTAPAVSGTTDIVIRFYRKSLSDAAAGKGGLSLLIPGSLSNTYYDDQGRRILKQIVK